MLFRSRKGGKAPPQQLPHGAKLSCAAGGLAGQAQKKYCAKLAALRAPSNAAQAKANGKPTHPKLKPAAREVAQPPKLLGLAKQGRKAPAEALCEIGWKADERAVSSNALPGRLACKLTCNLLPFGRLARKPKPCCAPRRMPCPAGFGARPAGPGGRHHFFFCQNEPRRKAMPG